MSIKNYYDHTPKSGKIEQIVILLHGVGSNGQDLISLAPMWQPFAPQAVFISPDAPFACDMAPPGYPNSYQWFSLLDRDPPVMLQGLKTVFPILERFIEERLQAYSLDYDKLALVGFSQGTMTSLYTAPRLKKKIAGVLAYSGALIAAESHEAMQKPPVHLIHGEADDVVPVRAWHFAKDVLEKDGFTVSGHTTPRLAHSIDMHGIEDGGNFLKKIFA
jgi:phospholipase/carboxylesterase